MGPVFALLLFLTGFAGLVHEVVWARWFALSYGGTAPAAAAVLAAYLGGLAAGAAWFGRIGDRSASPRRLFALLQLGAALCGAALLAVPAALPPVYSALVPAGSGALTAGAARFALAALFLFLPAGLMGGAFPVVARWAAAGREGAAARIAGRLHAANCLGAAAGALAAAWLLIPALGLRLSVVLAAGLSLAAAAAGFFLARDPTTPDEKRARHTAGPARQQEARALPRAAALVLAGLAGALVLCVELAQLRAVLFGSSSTIRAFAAVSAVCILALGAGSFLGGWLIRKPSALSAAPALAVLLALGGAFAGLSVPTLAAMGRGSGSLTIAFAACAPAMLALGAAFPLLVHLLSPSAGRVGRSVGGAAAALDLGSVAGPVVGALVLLPLLGTRWTLAALGGAAVLAALVLAFWSARRGSRLGAAGRWLIILALPAAVLPAAQTELYGLRALGTAPEAEPVLESQTEDLEAVVSLVAEREPSEGRRVRRLYIGPKMQAEDTTPWLRVEKRMGALPALLCPAARGRTLHVGLGSGVTAAWSAAAAPGRPVECAELSPAVARAAGAFRPHNSVATFAVSVADGRSRLLAERGRFELIVTDIVFPEDAGAGGLFSLEYFRLARSRLAGDGLFAQWIPLFQLPPEAFSAVVRSFLEVFPDATLWVGCLDAYRPVVMLLGSRGPAAVATEPGELAARIRSSRLKPAELADLGLGSPGAVLAHRVAGPEQLRELAHGARPSSDDLPLAELLSQGRLARSGEWGVRNLETVVTRLWEPGPGAIPDGPESKLRMSRRLLAEGLLSAASAGDAQTSLRKLRQARDLDPAAPEPSYALWTLLGWMGGEALRSGRPDLARELIEEALALGPARDYLLRDLAAALSALDRPREALERSRQAVRLDDRCRENWDTLAKTAWNAGEKEESRRAAERAAPACFGR